MDVTSFMIFPRHQKIPGREPSKTWKFSTLIWHESGILL